MRKAIGIALLTVLLPLLAASIGIAWLCYTASGLQFALLQLNHVPNLAIQVDDVSGRLAGPLHVGRMVLDHERVRIEIERLDVDLTPAFLLSGMIEINRLQAASVKAALKPPLTETPDKPINFLPAFLRISIDALDLQRAEYLHSSGYQIVATPLQGSAAISRSELQLTDLNVITREYDARGAVALEGGRSLNVLADLDAAYRINNGPMLRGLIKANGSVSGERRELKLEAQLREPHEANANAVLTFPESGWSLQGDATAQQVLLNAWWPQPAFSLRTLAAHFDLSNAGMRYSGSVVIPEWSPAQLRFAADTRFAQRVFTMQRVNLAVPATGVSVHAEGSITLNTGRKPLVDMRGNWQHLRWPLHAGDEQAYFVSPLGQMTLRGEQPYAVTVSGDVRAPQWPLSAVRASGELRPGEVRIDDFVANTLQGRASGSALIGFGPARNWRFNLRGANLDPSAIRAAWPGSININATGQGRGFDKNAAFDVQVHSLTGAVRRQVVKVTGRLQREGERWQADGIDAQWGGAHLSAQGVVGPQNNLNFTLIAPQLQQLHPDINGDVNVVGELSGPTETPLLNVRGQATRLAYAGWEMQGLKLDTRIDVTDESDSHFELTAATLMSGDNGMKNVLLKGDGRLIGNAISLEASPVNAWLPEDLRLRIYTGAAYQDGIWHGVLLALEVADGEQQRRVTLQGEEIPWRVSRNLAQLQSLCVSIDGGRACGHLDWQRTGENATWDANAQLQDLPLWISNTAWAAGTRLQAKLNGRFDFSAAPGAPWQGNAQLQLRDASLRYLSVTNREVVLPITLADLQLNADPAAVQTNAELRMGEQTVATLSANLDRTSEVAANWPLVGVLSLSSSDAKLIPVFVSEVDRAAGTLAGVMQLSGTASQPQFSGTVRLLEGELDFYRLNLALRAMQFDARLDTDRLQFTARANAGAGMLDASGDLNWRNALAGTLQLKGDRLLVADLPEYRVFASPDLRFDIQDRNVNVKGELVIPEAQLQPEEVTGAVQPSADARFKSDEVFDAKRSNWIIDSNVAIRLGDKVHFDGLGLQGQLGGEVSTRLRTGDVAYGSGELSVNNGSYEIYGQKLNIKRGRLIYDNTPLGDPGLDIQAERSITAAEVKTVGVNVRGLLRAPRLQFYSDPSMSQSQIVSYLLIGKPLNELQTGEATTVRSASNSLAIAGGGYLAAQLGRRIGLEQVGVETDAGNQSSLVLGKFLSPRLFVSYGISLTEAINTVKLRYTLSDRWTIKTEAGAARSADVEFRVER